jgi:hypothetical protein
MSLGRCATSAVAAIALLLGAAACTSGSEGKASELEDLNASSIASAGVETQATSASPPATDSDSGGSSPGSGPSHDTEADESSGRAITAANFGAKVVAAMTKAGSVHMVIKAPGVGTVLDGDLAGLGNESGHARLDARMRFPQGSARMRIVNSAVYIKVPGGTGSQWIKEPLGDIGAADSTYGEFAYLFEPKAMMSSFSAVKAFAHRGSETVDGVATEHYRVVVDVAKSLRQSLVHGVAGISLKELLRHAPKDQRADLWLDSENRVIKMTSDSGNEIHYSDWGKPAHIAAPPANQVMGLPQ